MEPDLSIEIYWPHGWDRDRFVHATGRDLIALNEEKSRMLSSLEGHLGTTVYKEWREKMNQNYQQAIKRKKEGKPSPWGNKPE